MDKETENELLACHSFEAGLQILLRHTEKFGVRDIFFGFMATPNAYARNAHVLATTFSDRLMDIYHAAGGVNRDPIAENLSTLSEPMFVDMEILIKGDENDKFSNSQFVHACLDDGYTNSWSIPFSTFEEHGMGVVTFFQETRVERPVIDPQILKQYALPFHQIMKEKGHLGSLLNLSKKEIQCLKDIAAGFTANDIANILDVTPRTVEKWLQSARKKMKSKTSSEAIYKATCFGVFNNLQS